MTACRYLCAAPARAAVPGREEGLLLVRLWNLPGITSLPPQLESGCEGALGIPQFKDRLRAGTCVAPLGSPSMGQGHLSSPEPSLQLLE